MLSKEVLDGFDKYKVLEAKEIIHTLPIELKTKMKSIKFISVIVVSLSVIIY